MLEKKHTKHICRCDEWMIVLDMRCEECNTRFDAPVTEIRSDMDMNMEVEEPLRTRAYLASLLERCDLAIEASNFVHSDRTSILFLVRLPACTFCQSPSRASLPMSELVWCPKCSVPEWQVFRRLCVYGLASTRHLSFAFRQLTLRLLYHFAEKAFRRQ